MPSVDLNTKPKCPLLASTELEKKTRGYNLVYPLSYSRKKMMVVGEALGADEEINSQYFFGKAGSLFNKLLGDVGLIRESIHVTNVVKIRPPDNKLDRLSEYSLSIEDFLPFLKEEIQTVQPTVILALGNTALSALCQESGILKQRGSVLQCTLVPGITVVPTLHPSYLQRGQMDLYPYVRNDTKIFAEIGFGFYTPETPWEEIIDPTLTQCLNYLDNIIRNSTQTTIDIETVAKQRITCIGFTKDQNSSICIPFRYNGLKLRWQEHEQMMLLRKMQEVFQVPGLLKIGQNIHYDLHHLLPLLGFPREPIFDTRYAHQLIHPDMRHDLGFIISAYTKMNYHKDAVKDWSSKDLPKDQTLWSYNCKDVIGTHRAAIGLIKDLKERDLYDFYCGYISPFRRVIFEMEHHGLKVNMPLHKEIHDYIQDEELPIALDIINKYSGLDLNPNSSKQVGEYLTSLGILVPKTPKGNYTVKEETLESLIAKHPEHRFILKQILCARVLKAKDLGTYLSALVSPDEHMKCSYGYTVTGRLTSSTDQFGFGTNLQNIPKHLKEIFIPEPGQVFMDADLSAAEARAMAYFMDSQKMKDVLNGPLKIHYKVGEWIFGKNWQDLNADEYLIAKKTVHGCVDDLTQVLTPKGWLYINELTQTHKIAQWDAETSEINFTHPTNILQIKSEGPVYLIKNQYINQYMTPEHRMPHYQVCYGRGRIPCKGPVRDIQAENFTPNRNSYKLPVSGVYSNTEQFLTKDEISLLVAIQADCTVRKSGEVEANFIKPYKIKRLILLLDRLDLDYSINPYKEIGRSFYIPRQHRLVYITSNLGPFKTFNLESLLLNDSVVLTKFVQELRFWDGRVNKIEGEINSWQYYTTNKHNAEVAQTLAHLTNHRATITERMNKGFGGVSNKLLYTVNISINNLCDITSLKKIKLHNTHPYYMYCPTVPKSYFLIRREDKISITGNSNYKMGVSLFSRIIGKPVHEARAIQEKYFTVVPELPKYHRDIQAEIESTRQLTNPFGRTRIFTGIIDQSTIGSGYAQKPQSTIVDMMNLGILGLYLIKPSNIHLLTQTHDSVLTSLPPNLYEWWAVFIKSHLEVLRQIEINGDTLRIPIEIDPPKTNWLGK